MFWLPELGKQLQSQPRLKSKNLSQGKNKNNNKKPHKTSKLANYKLSGFDVLNSKSGFKQNINNM